MSKVKIGGQEHDILLFEHVCNELLKKYNTIISSERYQNEANAKREQVDALYKERRAELLNFKNAGICTEEEYSERYRQLSQNEIIEKIVLPKTVPDAFIYYCAWTLLKKSGVWPFIKPFRSFRHMYRNIVRGEGVAIIQFIMSEVFGYKVNVDDPDNKKKAN
jgi:hypothetical protein